MVTVHIVNKTSNNAMIKKSMPALKSTSSHVLLTLRTPSFSKAFPSPSLPRFSSAIIRPWRKPRPTN